MRLIKFFPFNSTSRGCNLLTLDPAIMVTVLGRFVLYCKIVSNRSWSVVLPEE